MKGMRPLLITALVLAAAGFLAAQFKPEEVAKRDQWETFMAAADIIKAEDVGEGVTHPHKLTLSKDGVEAKAYWKNISDTLEDGALDNWRFEVASYRIDKLLGLGMIPVVIEREFEGKPGSLSLFAANRFSLLKVMEMNISIPVEANVRVNRMKYVTRAFDCLIANDDRTQQNILYTEDWRTILIDHSRAFRSDKAHCERLIYGQNGFKTSNGKPMLFRELPRSFVQAVRDLTGERITQAVGRYLTAAEVSAVMARRKLLLAEIDDMIKTNGEASVLY